MIRYHGSESEKDSWEMGPWSWGSYYGVPEISDILNNETANHSF